MNKFPTYRVVSIAEFIQLLGKCNGAEKFKCIDGPTKLAIIKRISIITHEYIYLCEDSEVLTEKRKEIDFEVFIPSFGALNYIPTLPLTAWIPGRSSMGYASMRALVPTTTIPVLAMVATAYPRTPSSFLPTTERYRRT